MFCDGALARDEHQAVQSRGGYIHPTRECVSRMNQPGRWERALKLAPNSLKSDAVAQVVKRMLLELPEDGGRGSGNEVGQRGAPNKMIGAATKGFKVKR